jgi:integrase
MSSSLDPDLEESLVASLEKLVDRCAQSGALAAQISLPNVTIQRRGKRGIFYLHVNGERIMSLKTNVQKTAEILRRCHVAHLTAGRIGVISGRATPLSTVCDYSLKKVHAPRPSSHNRKQNHRERAADIRRLAPYIAGKTIADVTQDWAFEAEDGLLKAGYAPSNVHGTLSAMKTMLRQYASKNSIQIQHLYDLPPAPPPNARVLTHEELERLLGVGEGFVWDRERACWATEECVDAVSGETIIMRVKHPPQLRTRLGIGLRLLVLALFTGTRHTALVDLRWVANVQTGWIDLDAGIVHRTGSERPKQTKGHGPAFFLDNLAAIFRAWRDADLDRGITCVIHRTDGSNYGKPYAQNAYALWREYMEAADVPRDVTPHIGRKSLASWARTLGVPSASTAAALSITPRALGHHYEMLDRAHEQVPFAQAIDRVLGQGVILPFANVKDANAYSRAYIPGSVAALPGKTREALGAFIDPRDRKPVHFTPVKVTAHFEMRPLYSPVYPPPAY